MRLQLTNAAVYNHGIPAVFIIRGLANIGLYFNAAGAYVERCRPWDNNVRHLLMKLQSTRQLLSAEIIFCHPHFFGPIGLPL